MERLYPALAKLFTLADAIVPQALRPGIEAQDLIRTSRANPSMGAREGLLKLTDAIKADSKLSFFGQVSQHWDTLRLLRNAQKIEDAHRANPALAATPISAPIFILGLPRSGTTFLHGLLAEDADQLVLRHWQTVFPAPRPAGFEPARDWRVRTAEQQLKVFASLAAGFTEQHQLTADGPQECCEITAHVFQSLRFDTTLRVPSYLRWLNAHGHAEAFAFHKKFLQFLQDGRPARWVLKCPDHTFTLDAILQTYPDARFVLVHRDPMAVLGSVAQLTEVVRRPFLKNIDPGEIGAQVSARWIEGANLLLQFDQRADISPERKIHLHYDALTGVPLASVARIYAQFGLAFSAEAEAAITRRIEARPRGGYPRHAPYSLDAFKISVPAVNAQFAAYVRAYCGEGKGL
ncbi:MAG: sulfotransferase family protein [Acidocella sp. 20-63-7]|nr:MAG: sulfotransferase family protein [Acidocella sp. 20-63-7]HQT46522.1 sulfotransferase [Acidocella sp.]